MSIAASLVQLALLQGSPAAAADTVWLEQCVAQIAVDAEAAYEEGMAWSNQYRRPEGWRCAAMALVELGRAAEGARRLEALGSSPDYGTAASRAEAMVQAGNAWLIAGNGAGAQRALTDALTLIGEDMTHLADILIDRSQAFALQALWRQAEQDLDRALDRAPENPAAYRLRAIARMYQNAFDLAVADAERAVALDPTAIEGLLALGHTREALRTGVPVAPGSAIPAS